MKIRHLYKKKIWFNLCCICIALTMLLMSLEASAAARSLAVIRVRQAKSQWCWAACCEMVGGWRVSTSRDQWAVVNLIWGGTYPDLPGSVDNIVSGVQFVSGYTKSAKSVNEMLSYSSIQSNINASKPMVGLLRWNNGGGHAIVFAGYNDDNNKVRCIDPLENTATQYYTYNALKYSGTFSTGSGQITHTVYY